MKKEYTPEELKQIDEFIYRSAAQRIVFSALLGAIRELIPSWMDTSIQKDKEILRDGKAALNRMFKQFDGKKLSDDKLYDNLVDGYMNVSSDMLKGLLNIMLEKDGDEQETTASVSDTDSTDSEQA
jgi:hypothetical protein